MSDRITVAGAGLAGLFAALSYLAVTGEDAWTQRQAENDLPRSPEAEESDASIEALELLIGRHQRWIYNIALRMVFQPQGAEDATQEILINLVTKLSTFRGESQFRTWLYRGVKVQVSLADAHVATLVVSRLKYGTSSSHAGDCSGCGDQCPDC